MAIGGLDIGGTGAKITVMGKSGRMIYSGYREYPVSRAVNAHEIDASDVWDAVKDLLRGAVSEVPNLSAVGVTSFGESFVALGENDEVLCPVMMYTDPRGEDEAASLREKPGDGFISSVAGTASYPMYSLPKLMWLKAHRPDVFLKTKHICLIGDFIVYMLTGRRMIDYSLAARTMGLDVRAKAWSEEIFAAAGIDPNLFSEPVPTGTDAGTIRPKVAAELGAPPDLRVVVCCHDQVAAAVGSGVTMPGVATDCGGTVQCMTPVFSSLPKEGALFENHYAAVPFPGDGMYCSYAFSFTGGSLIKWFVDNFAAEYRENARAKGMTIYELMEGQMRDDPTGILVLPHFAGAGTPYMDAGSEGAFVGIKLSHGPVDILRAIMEGVTFEMRVNMERLAESGIKINGLNATGGCAKSRLWLQMKADILGVPISRMSVDEAGTVGGIMLTGVATGVYADLDEAAETLVKTIEIYRPRRDARARYEEHYQRYLRLYGSVRPLMG